MHTLAVAVTEGVPIFELAIPCGVFGYERPGLTDWWYDFRLCAAPGTRTAAGFAPDAPYGLDALAEADTVVIPACASIIDEQPPDLVDAVRAAHANGADHGATVAGVLAERLVMPAHCLGGQAQYIDTQAVQNTDELGPLLDWARRHL